MPLEQLGPYKIERMLGRGGMGAVYAGIDSNSGQQAAIKVLSPVLADDPGFRERFKAEIETLKALRHPNIVQLFGYGEHDGHLFYAMELVDGRNLQDALQSSQRFDWRDVCRIGVEICQGLKHAHDVGVIHRDLKPANLLMTRDGTIKLTDFGIAKLFGMSHLTGDGGVLGTADYMAPEQAEGRPVTTRCDMYSLGSVLFALLARRPPFSGPSLPEVLHALKYDAAPSIRRYVPQTPRELEKIIAQLLEKDPQDRIATPLVLSNRLKAMLYAMPEEEEEEEFELRLQVETPPSVTKISNRTTQTSPEGKEQDGLNVTRVMTETPVAPAVEPAPVEAPARHFTVVDAQSVAKRESLAPPDDDGLPRWALLATAAVLVAIFGSLGWYFSLPASADSLISKIEAAAKESDPGRLADAETAMNMFLTHYSGDPRAQEVRNYQEDLETYRLQRSLEFRARHRRHAAFLKPVEQAVLDAMNLEKTSPEQAEQRYQAVIDLYGNDHDATINTKRCVDLARKQLQNLRFQSTTDGSELRKVLDSRLLLARSSSESDPELARQIASAIVTLYSDKPWAEESVAQAKKLLAELPAAKPTDAGG